MPRFVRPLQGLVVGAVMLLVTGHWSPVTAQSRAFTPNDWYRLTTVSSPAVSPDGKRIAFTVTTVLTAENKRHAEIWLVNSAGGEPMRLTSPGVESSNPRWSPDGKLLLFSSTRPGGKGRTWGLRMDQPGGEAFEVDSLPAGSSPRDGSFIVWSEADTMRAARDTTQRDPYARMQPIARPPFGAITFPVDPARFDGRHITEMQYKGNGMGFLPGPREAPRNRPSQIWLRPTAGGGGKKQFTNTEYSHQNVTVSPDGKWIAFTADSKLRSDSVVRAERDSLGKLPYDAKRDEAPRNETDIFVIPASGEGGSPHRVTTANGSEGDLEWSPDSRVISFVSRTTRTGNARLYVVEASGGGPVHNLLGAWQYEPSGHWWMPDDAILLSADIGGRTALFRLTHGDPQPREILGGRRRMSGFSLDDARTTVAYVSTSLTRPTELFAAAADGQGGGERQLTHFNDKLNAEIAWSDAERFTYKSVGGLDIEGWLMRPHGYEPGKKYPLVLYIHGGPHSSYGENWFDEFQNLAGAGMWVLFTNPRGSSGYGAPFTFSTRGRWGAEDYQDLMKAVDVVAKRPDVDSTRMGVTGGSYGGFMTASVTTKTTRFKAAQTDRMISEWTFWYGASDAQGLTEFEFYGKPWENQAIYDSLSPIRHVNRVKTPTLMVQSEEDYRTPMGNAELWYMALKKQGVPVELVRYPRSNHDLSRTGEPWLLVDRLGRLRQWFGYWLKDERAGGPVAGSDR